MSKILLIEDEESIRGFIKLSLNRFGFETYEAASGEEGLLQYANIKDVEIILLDIMLPGIDGFEVCKRIREQNEHVGIIMLTARSQEVDRINGLALGADDYINKPFSPSELIARIYSLLRRVHAITKKDEKANANKDTIIVDSIFTLNMAHRQLLKRNKPIELTPTEYSITEILIKNKNKPISRNDLLDEVWGMDYSGDTKIVDVNIRRLRQKIEEDPSQPTYITTAWGFGYQWSENME
ncbi:MAG: response regulator transcription factor [Bacillaceae bacterium]